MDLPFTDLQFHSLLQCIEGEGKQGRPIVILVCIGIQYGESILIVAAMQLFCIHNKLLAVSCVWMLNVHTCVRCVCAYGYIQFELHKYMYSSVIIIQTMTTVNTEIFSC